MTMNKRKTTTAIVAGVAAVALIIGGTFAWTSISQTAKNETAGVVNVGGRLHDDFDGTNKDVYVENFTDPYNGGQPIYARVKLTEYMEVGKEAGKVTDGQYDPDRDAVPVVTDTDINDKDNWPVHVPTENCATCNTGDTCLIHDHWKWTMGGEGDNNGQTTFMPTFNKDKDSLDADINGTYQGTDPTDKVYYDDYVLYTTTEQDNGVGVPETDKENFDGEIYSLAGDARYDNDPDGEPNTPEGSYTTKPETHTAKQTSTAQVMTMQAWIDAGSQPGNYWVYDTDGWAYWANPIMPGEATGLLLDGINMEKNPGEKCYYSINVVGQFATIGDWEYFDGDEENGVFDGTPEAEALLTAVSQNVATVTVTNVTGNANVSRGDQVTFSASIATPNGTATVADAAFEWKVLGEDLKEIDTSTFSDNDDGTVTLTVGNSEKNAELVVVAKATDPAYLGAVGMSALAVDLGIKSTNDQDARAYALFVDREGEDDSYDLFLIRSHEDIEALWNSYQEDSVNNCFYYQGQIVRAYTADIESKSDIAQSDYIARYIRNIQIVNEIHPTTLEDWFGSTHSLESLTGLENIKLDRIDSTNENAVKYMFNGMSDNIRELDLRSWDVSNLTTMANMFVGCNAETIDITSWNTSNVTDMASGFAYCEYLKEIKGIESIDTAKVKTMSYMFFGTVQLTADCSGWDVGQVWSNGHDEFRATSDEDPTPIATITEPNWDN